MRPRTISDDHILGTVRDCVLEFGPSVSTQKIAERAGVSQATLFKRFGTKIELLRKALLLPVKGLRLISRLERGPSAEPVLHQLRSLCMEMITFYEEFVPFMSAMRSAGIHPGEGVPLRARLALEAWLEQLREEGRIGRSVDCQATAVALIGALQAPPFRRHLLRDNGLDRSNEEYVDCLLGLLWAGLSPGEEG